MRNSSEGKRIIKSTRKSHEDLLLLDDIAKWDEHQLDLTLFCSECQSFWWSFWSFKHTSKSHSIVSLRHILFSKRLTIRNILYEIRDIRFKLRLAILNNLKCKISENNWDLIHLWDLTSHSNKFLLYFIKIIYSMRFSPEY